MSAHSISSTSMSAALAFFSSLRTEQGKAAAKEIATQFFTSNDVSLIVGDKVFPTFSTIKQISIPILKTAVLAYGAFTLLQTGGKNVSDGLVGNCTTILGSADEAKATTDDLTNAKKGLPHQVQVTGTRYPATLSGSAWKVLSGAVQITLGIIAAKAVLKQANTYKNMIRELLPTKS